MLATANVMDLFANELTTAGSVSGVRKPQPRATPTTTRRLRTMQPCAGAGRS